ncbi:MAG TPA: hypothetical protein PKA13_04740 [Geminicoccaceae bacterium]|nr:hypothetical protein [Geminicoccus sp.]HMU49058.1 hypothetical protein [Geminicoccaceae bacterium]
MAAHSRNAVAFDLIQDEMPGLLSAGEADPHADQADDLLTLRLEDLLQDDNGEVVLFNDSGLRALAVATDAGIVAEGSSGHHVTAAGEDVSGFHYVTFDTGLTLYYQNGLEVIVRGEPA